MALPGLRPINEASLQAQTTSIASTPVVGQCVVTNAGYLQRVMAAAAGTTTGTITVAVSINNAADLTSAGLLIAPASNARAGTVFEINQCGAGTTSGIFVNEGDIITFTPSGGTGSSIGGAFGAVIRCV